ncbi:hypothetical protein LR013_05005 [candidate division NPL-UPA2 bacterium]|nr:hypothetical protein [candidate division NPL-UPA2 bacterium]
MFSQSYTNIEVNIKVADGQFKFTPPEGAQVIDMTDEVLNMMKQTEK